MPGVKASPSSAATTIFLFGDQTDSWVNGLDQLYRQAASTPWLSSFLNELGNVINAETRAITLDRALQNSLGHFSSLQELGEQYRHSTDELGVVRTILLHCVGAGTLLQWVKREPDLLGRHARTEWLGLSGGLLTLSALAIAEDFESLYYALLEATRVVVRFCKLTSVRSRAVEDQTGTWGWAVLGIALDDLRKALDQFQETAGIPITKRAKVAVTGPGWSTVIGPPSVLSIVIDRCPDVKNAAKNPLEIKALQHTLEISSTEIDYIVGHKSPLLGRSLTRPSYRPWGIDEPPTDYANWGDMLRDACLQVLVRPLDIVQVMQSLSSKLVGVESVRVLQAGSSSHAPYLASVLKTPGREVSIFDHYSLLHADDGGAAVPPGRIAIVGMAGRGPGSDNYEEFWELIMAKRDLCTEVPKDRFDVDEYHCSVHERGDKACGMTTRYGCFMDNPGHFDSRFFHISPREAMLMDPNHRQFLMSTYEALEMAGYSNGKTRTTDPNRIASFYGQCADDWLHASHPTTGCDAYTLQGVQRAFGPGRPAWQFKWEGPTYSLDSACASSTAGIHLASMSLLTKDIDMAIVGAANILSYPHSFTCLSDAGVLSDTGNCKPFRDDADGYCKADFVGAVVLKRLEDAVAHNDNILAVVASSGRNHSGNSTSITTSDAAAQERLFRKVFHDAQVSPDDISYVEMHGTGTQVGDPAEVGAIANTFKHRRRIDGPLNIGGVKANVGHSEAAAGMAELMKCIMMFENDTIPPQQGMPHALNPKLPALSELNIKIPSEPQEFKNTSDKPRRILLNNFDAAGGNACMVLEDYCPNKDKGSVDPRSCHIVTVSARTKASFQANKSKMIEWLRANPDTRLEDVAYTTTARKMHHPFRFSCPTSSVQDLIGSLEATNTKTSPSLSPENLPVVFCFTGQGSHYAGMGAELYRTSPVFRETIDLCVATCDAYKFPSFIKLITDTKIDMSTKNAAQTQLAIAALEIALTAFWRSAGVEPAMVMGHSLGEYAALHAAGVLSLTDTLYLVGRRALLLLERCEPGTCAMLALPSSVETVRKHLSHHSSSSCEIACINGPSATVVSGMSEDLSQFQEDAKIRGKTLSIPFAFHSFQVDAILQDYISVAGSVTYSAPKIPVASTLLAQVIHEPGTFNQDYLAQQTRQSVDFVGGLHAAKSNLKDAFWLEVGPASVCTSFIQATISPPAAKIIHTIDAKVSNWTSVSTAMSAAYKAGVNIDWLSFHRCYENNLELLRLPAYAWDMKNYWITYTDKGRELIANAKEASASPEPFLATCTQYLIEKYSSPKIQVKFRASISDPEFLALIDGHKMQQIALASGSVFCEAALSAAKYVLEYSGRNGVSAANMTVHDPDLLIPLTKTLVGVDGELITTAIMDSPSSNTISVSWKAISKTASHEMGSITVKVSNPEKIQVGWDRMSYFVKAAMDDLIKKAKEGSGHRMQPSIFYALFSKGVEFSSTFKGVQEAYIAPDFQQAAALITLPSDPPGSRFTQSPYWSEALVHLAGFMVNGNPGRSSRTTFVVMGFESAEQTVVFEPNRQYMTYTRINRWEKETAFCDAFVFELDSSKIVMQVLNVRYTELPAATWRHVLEGGHGGSKQSTASSHSHGAVERKFKSSGAVEGKGQIAADSTASNVQATTEQPKEEASGPSVFDLLLKSIVKSTGSDPSEFTDDTALADIGIDSIMAIEVAGAVRNEVDIDLAASFVFEYPTIGDLRRAFGEQSKTSEAAEEAVEEALESSSEHSDAESPSTSPRLSESNSVATPSSSVISIDNENTMIKKDTPLPQEVQPSEEDKSPQPTVKITLLQGRPDPSKTSLYMMADGTGSIATYIHLPRFKSKMPVYGIDSPFFRCPSRMTGRGGIEAVAKLVVDALVKAQPNGPFYIGGFSAGCMVAFEVSRQLGAAGRKVDGLILIDLSCPRPTSLSESEIKEESRVGTEIFKTAVASDGLWSTAGYTLDHMNAYFLAMRLYNPPTMTDKERPARTAAIWAEKGMINRVAGDADTMKKVADNNLPSKAYPGYMEDPNLGPMGCLLPDKTEADLGPNGWERYVGGEVMALSVPGTHLDLPMPGTVHLTHKQMEKAFEYFTAAG